MERVQIILGYIVLFIQNYVISVGKMSGYMLDGRCLNPKKRKVLLFSESRPAQGSTSPPIQCVLRTILLELKRQKRDTDL
jgi:hypothetical protein